ncbi:hypothetical protein D3C76_1686410 [compost metagenome]
MVDCVLECPVRVLGSSVICSVILDIDPNRKTFQPLLNIRHFHRITACTFQRVQLNLC